MERLLSNAQMRAADEYTIQTLGVPSAELMRRAGEAIAEEVEKVLAQTDTKSVTVVCGTGNNGGDGYVCARILHGKGIDVKVYAMDGRYSADCAREKQAYTGGYTQQLNDGVIVDCIFGTGLDRAVAGAYAGVIERINASGAYVVSADIPSGINGDNGIIMGCAVRADLTVAIAEYKLGFVLGDGMDLCGAIVKRDIGITADGEYAHVYADGDIAKFYPTRRRNTHKGSYGCANLVVGSQKYTGAAALCVSAALQSGCGFVKLTSPECVKNALVAAYPQVIYTQEIDLDSICIAVGSGCGVSRELYLQIGDLLSAYRGNLVIDADGLNSLARFGKEALKTANCRVLITPHAKEFSRLTGGSVEDVLSDPVQSAKKFAAEYGVTVLLKGAATVVTDGRRTAINTRGTTALSKGGSGDLLTGLICGNCARGLGLFDGAVASSYVLGLTAELCSRERTDYCVTAREIVKNMYRAVKCLTDGR